MIKAFKIATAVLALFLTGCASVVTTSGNSALNIPASAANKIVMEVKGNDETSKNTDWPQFVLEWNKQMAGIATVNGLEYKYQVNDKQSTADSGTLVAIKVNDYRYITSTTRVLAGVMTGNAWLDVDVEYRDLASGNVIGTRNYQTKSTAWQGAFSAMTEKQIESVCNEIVGTIIKRTPMGVESQGKESTTAAQQAGSTVSSAATVTGQAAAADSIAHN